MTAGRIAVLDFGKTNAKITVTDPDGTPLDSVSAPNQSRPGPPWRSHDLRALGDWALDTLAGFARRHPLERLIPTAHGSGGVLTAADPDAGGDGAALPMIDYEEPPPPQIDEAYRREAGGFFDRGSAIMFACTHQARQLLRMEMERPAEFAAARWHLNLPQYWAWRLTGVAACEFSALGAQSQLWNTPERRWSSIVTARGWSRLMPPFAPASAALGPVRHDLVRRFGLPPGLVAHTGAHDSSANYYRYQAGGLTDFTLVSTGTWIVAMTAASRDSLGRLDERRGMTINADVTGAPVAGALTMGGRAFSRLAGPEPAQVTPANLRDLVASGAMALPGFADDDGQFPGTANRGRVLGPPPEDTATRRALALLHVALLTDACADAPGRAARLVLDGTFLQEPLFAPLVTALRPDRPTLTCAGTSGVAVGAALLATQDQRKGPAPLDLAPALPLNLPGLEGYARIWRDRAAAEGTPT